MSTKAFSERYNLFLHVPCDVYKHLADQIEGALILFYSQTYLCSAVSEQDFGPFGVVSGLVRDVLLTRHFLNGSKISHMSHMMCANINIFYIPCDMCNHFVDQIEGALILI